MISQTKTTAKNAQNQRLLGSFGSGGESLPTASASPGVLCLDTSLIGLDIQERVQSAIATQADGELLVGQALVIPTPEGPFSYLISAPTMRRPGPVPFSDNAYLAFRAILRTALMWYQSHPDTPLPALYVPGLATGAGLMSPRRAARQMRAAWEPVCALGATAVPTSLTLGG